MFHDSLTLIRESWKKFQNAGLSPSAFCGKKSRAQRCIILYMFPCFGIFFRKARSVTVPKNGIYFCSARHISANIGICHLKSTSQYGLTDTLSAHIIFIFQDPTVTSSAVILDVFSQKTRSMMVPNEYYLNGSEMGLRLTGS